MNYPKVSVIIPAYKQANYLGDAIESVLNQTFMDFEVIVVNDASPDHTTEVINRFSDPRLKYIIHDKNRMLAASRNTGIRASWGQIIVFLDADDLFHPEKIQAHVEFLDKYPEVGVTYNARFGIYDAPDKILNLWRPPQTVNLSDLVLGFPFAPSDMVVRREWLFRVGLFDESLTNYGEDLDLNCRLALAGCRFAGIDRSLNYRRFHPDRVLFNLSARLEAMLNCLQTTFSDSRCPAQVRARREEAFAIKYLGYSYFAFAQSDTALGRAWIREAVRLKPNVLEGVPCQVVDILSNYASADESVDFETRFNAILDQLPSELNALHEQYDEALARGFLEKGMRALIWGRSEMGSHYCAKAQQLGRQIDKIFLQYLAHELLSYEKEFGSEKTPGVLSKLEPFLIMLGGEDCPRRLKGTYWINSAFENYRAGNYPNVPMKVLRAIHGDLSYLVNRGAISILLRSLKNNLLFRPVGIADS